MNKLNIQVSPTGIHLSPKLCHQKRGSQTDAVLLTATATTLRVDLQAH